MPLYCVVTSISRQVRGGRDHKYIIMQIRPLISSKELLCIAFKKKIKPIDTLLRIIAGGHAHKRGVSHY